jgi:hypothetical protein
MGSTTRSFAAFGRKTRHYPYNGRRSAASGQRNCANAAALKPEYDVVSGAPQEEQHGLLHDLASRLTKIALASTMGAETARNVSAFRVFRTRLREGFQEYRSPYAALVLIVASTGYSLLILRPDAEFANFGRAPCTG